MAGQIVLIRVSTGVLSPAQLGSVTQLTAFANLFSLVLVTPVSMYLVRAFREWQESGALRLAVKRFVLYVIAVAAVATVLAALAQARLVVISGFTVGWTAFLVGLYVVAVPLGSFGTTAFNLQNKRGAFALFVNLPVWLGLVLSVVLFQLASDAAYWVLGQFLALAVACVSLLMLRSASPETGSAGPSTVSPAPRAVAAFAWPIGVQAALWWIQSQAYRFILTRVATPADVGLFSVGYGLAATPVAIYEGVFAQFYEPIFYGELKGQAREGQASAWNNYARAYIPGLVPIGIFVTLSGPFMAKLLLGDAFQSASRVVVLAGLTELLRGTGAMMHHLGVAKLDNRIVLLPVAIGAILAPLGVWVLAPADPLLGTATARLLAGIAVAIVIFVISRRTMSISWPVREVARALAYCVPLGVGMIAAQFWLPAPTLWQSAGVLTMACLYIIAIELKILTVFQHRDLAD